MKKKILIRAGMSPLSDTPVQEIITYNRIGSNVGNLVYAYSIFRALTTEDVELIPSNYKISQLPIEQINEEYSSFVIPLADAFRNSFVGEMRKMTALINKLTIPCHIVGIGVRAPYNYQEKGLWFNYDDEAREFLKAVLNRSAMIGVRGEITGDYLKKLGFLPEVDYTVIGCPSFYCYGEDLNTKPFSINADSRIAINNTVMTGKTVQDFLIRLQELCPNHSFFPQRINELRTLYLAHNYKYKRKSEGYPSDIYHPLYQSDKVEFYKNIYGWLEKLAGYDFSIGPRLHGNVAAVLAGIPALWIMHDARMKELVEYHNLPSIKTEDIANADDIMELISVIDYNSMYKGHAERFRHYVDFLNKNEIDHIFKDYKNPKLAPIDAIADSNGIKDMDHRIGSFLKCSPEEQIHRINVSVDYEEEKAADPNEATENLSEMEYLRDTIKSLKSDMSSLNAELKASQKELREAKRGIWYIIKRKIRRLLNKAKHSDDSEGGKQCSEQN